MTTEHQAHYGSIKSMFLAFFLLIQCQAATHAFADKEYTALDNPALRGIVLLTASTGSMKLAHICYVDGETSNIKAGDGGMLAIGVLWTGKQFELQSTFGHCTDSAPASNGEKALPDCPSNSCRFGDISSFELAAVLLTTLIQNSRLTLIISTEMERLNTIMPTASLFRPIITNQASLGCT